MDIGIIGAGSLGLLYSYYLSKRNTITLYTNHKQQSEEINSKGISMLKNGIYSNVGLFASHSRTYHEPLLIVTVKQYDLNAVISELVKLTPRTILFLQNGMGHLPCLNRLTSHNIILGIVEHGACRINKHSVEHTGVGQTKIAYYSRSNNGIKVIDYLLAEHNPNFPFDLKEDWKIVLSEKLVVNATINPLTAILQVKNGALLDNPHFYSLFKNIFKEIIQVLELMEYEESLWTHTQGICKNTAQNESSMYRDIVLRKQTEIDAILGYLIHQASENKTDIPLITFLYHTIKGIEAK